jgi:uncharacterized protein YbaA (DUF1428 family)
MTYVDGFVIPVQKGKLAQYRKMARLGAEVWMDHGALDYKECVAEDLHALVPDERGRLKRIPSLFPAMVQAKRGETVVFSYIVYRSKAHRTAVNKKVFADPRMTGLDPAQMPVDMARMATAGFKTLVEAGDTAVSSRSRRAARPRKAANRRPSMREPEVVWSR